MSVERALEFRIQDDGFHAHPNLYTRVEILAEA